MNSKKILLARLIFVFVLATVFCAVLLTYYPVAAVACIPMYLLIIIRAKEVFSGK